MNLRIPLLLICILSWVSIFGVLIYKSDIGKEDVENTSNFFVLFLASDKCDSTVWEVHYSWNRLYDKHSIERDKDIKSSLTKKSIDCNSSNGYLLSEPWEIKNKSGSFFKVFTPFWKTNFETLSKKLGSNSSKNYNFYKPQYCLFEIEIFFQFY